MNYWDEVKRLLRQAPCTTPELAAECETSIKTMNSRMQFYKYLGYVKHNGRHAPKRGGVGRRAMFWELA